MAFPAVLSCRSSWPMDEALLLLVVRHEKTPPGLFVGESDGGTFYLSGARTRRVVDCHSCYPTNTGMGTSPGSPSWR